MTDVLLHIVGLFRFTRHRLRQNKTTSIIMRVADVVKVRKLRLTDALVQEGKLTNAVDVHDGNLLVIVEVCAVLHCQVWKKRATLPSVSEKRRKEKKFARIFCGVLNEVCIVRLPYSIWHVQNRFGLVWLSQVILIVVNGFVTNVQVAVEKGTPPLIWDITCTKMFFILIKICGHWLKNYLILSAWLLSGFVVAFEVPKSRLVDVFK